MSHLASFRTALAGWRRTLSRSTITGHDFGAAAGAGLRDGIVVAGDALVRSAVDSAPGPGPAMTGHPSKLLTTSRTSRTLSITIWSSLFALASLIGLFTTAHHRGLSCYLLKLTMADARTSAQPNDAGRISDLTTER